jgi:predicted RND superfamily exporter protein
MTATAFNSLWSSKNPGISSMGQLLALSLLCTLASAALFQPALMGPSARKQHAGWTLTAPWSQPRYRQTR